MYVRRAGGRYVANAPGRTIGTTCAKYRGNCTARTITTRYLRTAERVRVGHDTGGDLGAGGALLGEPVQRIAGLYGSSFSLRGRGPEGSAVLLAGGVVLGWFGSFIAATREIRGIEPK